LKIVLSIENDEEPKMDIIKERSKNKNKNKKDSVPKSSDFCIF
jgi:hypothetical protein